MFSPQIYDCEGFFVARLRKNSGDSRLTRPKNTKWAIFRLAR